MSNSEADEDNNDIIGKCYRIKFCDGALESFQQALGSIKQKRRDSLTARIKTLIERLADGICLGSESDVAEGQLPDGSRFRALKKIPIRCYYWKSSTYDDVIFVSHFIYKDQQKLDKRTTEKVSNNWRRYEN
ncbi:hypothetical protein [Marinobacterium stanieri]|uniref:hypothetical protein n=1 Tax=Marinobacterium stanieri TaxID=49186 RepID=UPI00025588A6|nr:hypothetical protein [Marinobacterium stanieri]